MSIGAPEILTVLVPVLTALGGAATVLVTQTIQRRWNQKGDDLRSARKALTELLEVQNAVHGLSMTRRTLADAGIPPEMLAEMTALLTGAIDVQALRARYEDAVTGVSAIDPMLAFRLRNKSSMLTVPEKILGLAVLCPRTRKRWAPECCRR